MKQKREVNWKENSKKLLINKKNEGYIFVTSYSDKIIQAQLLVMKNVIV